MWRSLVSALVWGTRGRRFKSSHSDHRNVQGERMRYHSFSFFYVISWLFFPCMLFVILVVIFVIPITLQASAVRPEFFECVIM